MTRIVTHRHRTVSVVCRFCRQTFGAPANVARTVKACKAVRCQRALRKQRRSQHNQSWVGAARHQSARCPSCRVVVSFTVERSGRVYEVCRCGAALMGQRESPC
jgi:hypothetical protein